MADQELEKALRTISAALNALHAPSSPANARRAAQIELDKVKEFPPQAILQISSRLLQPLTSNGALGRGESEAEVHFGFHILEDGLMRGGWSALSDEFRLAVRNLVGSAVKGAVIGSGGFGFVKRKGASVLSGIAVREWPQRWPRFVEDLIEGTVPVEMACMVLRSLSEDVMEFTDIIERDRKKELVQALTISLELILPYVSGTIEKAFSTQDAPLMGTALETLAHYLTWCPATTAFQYGAPKAMCTLLAHEQIRDEAVDALLNFCSRRDQKSKGAQEAFRNDLFTPLLDFCSAVDFITLDPDQHEFVTKITDVLCALGKSHFEDCFLASTLPPEIKQASSPLAIKFYELMLTLSANSSLVISMAAIPFFSSLFANLLKPKQAEGDVMQPVKQSTDEYKDLATQFLRAITVSLARIKMRSIGDDAKKERLAKDMAYVELDFEGMMEYEAGYKRFRSLATQAIVRATNLCPHICVEFSLSALGAIFQRQNAQEPDEVLRTGRGVIWAAEPVIAAVNTVKFFNEANPLQLLEMCFNRVLSCQDEQFNLLRGLAFRLFIPLYKVNRNALKTALQALIEDHEKTRTGQIDLNRLKYLSVPTPLENLVLICRRTQGGAGAPLAEVSGGLCDMAVRSMSNLAPAEHYTRLACIEAATYAILDVTDYGQRVSLSERLFVAPLQVVENDRVLSMAFAEPEALYTFLTKGAQDDVLKVVQSMQLIERATHRLVKPQSSGKVLRLPNEVSPGIAPKTVKIAEVLIKTLHSLYDPNVFVVNSLDTERVNILQPTTQEYAFLLNVSYKELTTGAVGDKFVLSADGNGGGAVGSVVRMAKSHLKHLRDSAYEIVANTVLSGVTASPSYFNPLLNSLLSHFDRMRPLHMYYLTHRVLSVLLSFKVFQYHSSISVESFTTYLQTLNTSRIPAFLQYTLRLLTENVGDGSEGTESEELELGRRMLGTSAADMLQSIYNSGAAPIGQDRKAPPLMSHQGELTVCLWNLFGCIVGPIGGCRQGLNLLLKLVEWAPQSPEAGMQGVGRLLGIILSTAIVKGGTEVGDLAERCILAMIEKWGSMVIAERLMESAAKEGPDVVDIMRDGAKDLVEIKVANGAGKKAKRDTLRKLLYRLDKLADSKGWSAGRQLAKAKSGREKKVKSLPDKLVIGQANASRDARQLRNGNGEEVVLADFALDSLYGKGPPL